MLHHGAHLQPNALAAVLALVHAFTTKPIEALVPALWAYKVSLFPLPKVLNALLLRPKKLSKIR